MPHARRAPRDPDGRRRVVVEAAAELILEVGPHELTHRKVASRAAVPLGSTTSYFGSLDQLRTEALQLLINAVDDALAILRADLSHTDDVPGVLSRHLAGYLADRRRVRAEAAFYIAGASDPALRPLATRWFDGLVEILQEHTEAANAAAVAVYCNGATVHATLHTTTIPHAQLSSTISRLMRTSDVS